MAEQTLNVPQLLVFLIVSVLAVRWYLAKPTTGGAQSSGPGRRVGVDVTAAQIDQIAAMFPQHDRRQIAWDLQRNGGNMGATTEKILTGRTLEVPPASFNPPPPQASPAARPAAPAVKPSQPDLITRYNLASKLNSSESSTTEASPQKQKIWSQDRNERQANLQRRREEMIMAARRKLEAKEKSGASQ